MHGAYTFTESLFTMLELDKQEAVIELFNLLIEQAEHQGLAGRGHSGEHFSVDSKLNQAPARHKKFVCKDGQDHSNQTQPSTDDDSRLCCSRQAETNPQDDITLGHKRQVMVRGISRSSVYVDIGCQPPHRACAGFEKSVYWQRSRQEVNENKPQKVKNHGFRNAERAGENKTHGSRRSANL